MINYSLISPEHSGSVFFFFLIKPWFNLSSFTDLHKVLVKQRYSPYTIEKLFQREVFVW